jgi:hypothetical protein
MEFKKGISSRNQALIRNPRLLLSSLNLKGRHRASSPSRLERHGQEEGVEVREVCAYVASVLPTATRCGPTPHHHRPSLGVRRSFALGFSRPPARSMLQQKVSSDSTACRAISSSWACLWQRRHRPLALTGGRLWQ